MPIPYHTTRGLDPSSIQCDTDFQTNISDNPPHPPAYRAKGINPPTQEVTKGWLRASHRALYDKHSTEMEPYHLHTRPEPLKPNEVYRFDISIEPNAFQFKKGNRVRLEIVNGDSPLTDVLCTH